jgi:hypothetical protein
MSDVFTPAEQARVLENLTGESISDVIAHHIRQLDNIFYARTNLRPIYQRNIRWTHSKMNDFIKHIMRRGMVPEITLYKLSIDERTGKNENKMQETIDGQHRLFAIKAFMDATLQNLPHIKKPFVVYYFYEQLLGDGSYHTQCVFYKKTDDVIAWCNANKKTPYYLNAAEKERFDEFRIGIKFYEKMSLEKRRANFMSLQMGTPVRNSDFIKNKSDCKFIAFITLNQDYEEMMSTFFEHCYRKVNNYWVEWICRCFLLYKHFLNRHEVEEPVSETFLIKDKEIQKLVTQNDPVLNPQDLSIIHDFDDVFREYIEFLQSFKEGVEINPTQIFALFYTLCDKSKNQEIVLSHIPYLSREGNDKKKIWEGKNQQAIRREYFNECFHQMNAITERASPYDARPMTDALRQLVRDKCVDGKCEICKKKIKEGKFHAGHIVARARGGQTEIENLLPMCQKCNLGMSEQNAREYQKDMYPKQYAKYIAETELANQEI